MIEPAEPGPGCKSPKCSTCKTSVVDKVGQECTPCYRMEFEQDNPGIKAFSNLGWEVYG